MEARSPSPGRGGGARPAQLSSSSARSSAPHRVAGPMRPAAARAARRLHTPSRARSASSRAPRSVEE